MTLGDWTLEVTGEVTRIDREDLDKSGRNPKFMLSYVLRADDVRAPDGATLPAELAIRIKDLELARLTDRPPAVGDRVAISARASGPRPATLYMTAVRVLER